MKNTMMKKTGMKQMAVCLTLLLIMALLLTGCGGGSEPAPAPAPEETSEPAAETGTSQEPASSPQPSGDGASARAMLESLPYPDEMFYEMVYSAEGFSMNMKVWVKGDKSRVEGTNPMEGTYMVIEDGEYSYMLDPEEMTAMKFAVSDDDMSFGDDLGDELLDDFDWDNMEYVGEETINGIRTRVFRYLDDDITAWIHSDYAFPIRVEGIEEGQTYVMEVTDFKVGGVSNDIFQVPAGYEIIEFNW